jgi:hypothetical protein
MDSKIEGVIDSIEAWSSSREGMRNRCAAWIRSPEFRDTYYYDVHPPMVVKAALEKEAGKEAGARFWAKVAAFGPQSRELWEQYQQLAAHGQVLFANPVIVNPSFKVQRDKSVPCLVLASKDQGAMAVAAAAFLATGVADLYLGAQSNSRPRTQALVCDDEYKLFRRRSLPVEETEGLEAVLFDVQLRQAWMLPEGTPFIPLLAMPGAAGAVVQIPWNIAVGAPPVPGSMKLGQFAEFSEPHPSILSSRVTQPPKERGFFWWFRMIVAVGIAFGALLIFALIAFFKSSGPPPPKPHPQYGLGWTQSADSHRWIRVVPAVDYEPLRAGNTQAGFVFRAEQGFFLAATSRQPADDDKDSAPKMLSGAGNVEVTLNTDQVLRLPKSRIQLVSAVNRRATSLVYQSLDVLESGDELLVILGKDRRVVGKLASPDRYPLSSAPVLLRMETNDPEGSKVMSGLPVVQGKTGRVVGVMQRADLSTSPAVLEFETLGLPPK